MTFVSFPIAYPDHLVYPHSSVSFVTFLLPQDDTPDVIPHHTYLRHAQYVSVNRNFRLNPKEVSGLSSLALPPSLCISASMCSASRAGETRDRAERGSKAAKRMSTPRPAPPNPYSLVSRETREDNYRPQPGERELDMRPGCRTPSSCASAPRFARHCAPARARTIPRRHSLLTCFT